MFSSPSPTIIIISSISASSNSCKIHNNTGSTIPSLLIMGRNAFFIKCVSGYILVPNPAIGIIAFLILPPAFISNA